MSASFEIKINNILTAVVGDMPGVIKKVEFEVVGTQNDITFSQPQTCTLADPESGSFLQLADVKESDVIAWVEASFDTMEATKECIQEYLDAASVRQSLQAAPLPWVPEAASE